MGKFANSEDGTSIYYTFHKGVNPTTIVFLHGVGANWTVWKREIDYFKRKGFSTLALDFRGHGKSDSPEEFNSYKLPDFSGDVFRVLSVENISDFVLVGHSLGGAVTINYCMLYKKLYPKSIVLVESASTYPFDHNRLLNRSPYVSHFLRFIAKHTKTRKKHLHHFEDCDLSDKGIEFKLHLISHLLHLTPLQSIVRTLDNVEKYVFKNQKRIDYTLSHLRIPTLLIAGELDRVVPLKFSKRIKELDKKAVLKVVKGGHHTVIINQPHKVSKEIESFVSHITS